MLCPGHIKNQQSRPHLLPNEREIWLVVFEHVEGTKEGHVGLLRVCLFLQEFIVLLVFDMCLLLFVTEEPD
jgi:hypothetical protein